MDRLRGDLLVLATADTILIPKTKAFRFTGQLTDRSCWSTSIV
jgi:hypothetical protein